MWLLLQHCPMSWRPLQKHNFVLKLQLDGVLTACVRADALRTATTPADVRVLTLVRSTAPGDCFYCLEHLNFASSRLKKDCLATGIDAETLRLQLLRADTMSSAFPQNLCRLPPQMVSSYSKLFDQASLFQKVQTIIEDQNFSASHV